ncbi:DegQ family serine endoprotease [Thioclava sp. GXIMD4216]|uniref:Probable periplasmic serine endoprotease DegP-like n=1 Tax=Thioclava litoralis TaxID=3076557 RepID=A0ABZ1DZ21_9RHOB|nr:DegQ family serine endoprotease [Thioclava sp. FTW29]
MTIQTPAFLSAKNVRGAFGAAAVAAAIALTPLHATPVFAKAAPDSFADLAQKVSPSVVMITTSMTVSTPTQSNPMFPEGSPFDDLFRDFGFPDQGQQSPSRPHHSNALGSGFVISEDGYIVTNNHVIENADDITVAFFDGTTKKAKLIGTDPKTDIALLKVETDKPLPFVPFGDSDKMRVGDWVMAMGNPLGQNFSASAGIVSARNRELSGTYDDYIQTDAAINRGNSGGPLFDMNGEVIGVNTAILSPNGGSIGIGFSMASNVVKNVVSQLQQYGETRRGWLGVKIQDVTDDMTEALGLSSSKGALVSEVPDGPAKDAGMQAGDVIVKFDGGDVADTRDLVRRVAKAPIGEKVQVIVQRDGKEKTLTVTLGRRETSEDQPIPAAAKSQSQDSDTVLGMSIEPLNDDLRGQLDLPSDAKGLVISDLDEESDAYDKGLRAGDVIAEAGQQDVTSVTDLQDRVKEAKDEGRKSLLLLIRRGGEPRFVALPVK